MVCMRVNAKNAEDLEKISAKLKDQLEQQPNVDEVYAMDIDEVLLQ